MAIDRLTRHHERGSDDRALLDDLLDGESWGTLSTVTPDGEPWVVPVFFARDGDRILVHGSTGAGLLRAAASGAPGAPVALCVVALDALVVGHTTFDSSANYRSAVVRGRMTRLNDAEKPAALELLSDSLLPGRVAEVRPSNDRELAATQVLALPIEPGGWVYKARDGQASEPDETTDSWGGVVPLVAAWGEPEPAPWASAPVPASVRRLAGLR